MSKVDALRKAQEDIRKKDKWRAPQILGRLGARGRRLAVDRSTRPAIIEAAAHGGKHFPKRSGSKLS